MSRVRKNLTLWTCDSCGADVEVDDMGDGYLPVRVGWRQFLLAPLDAQLGNLTPKHLCGDCVAMVHGLLDGSLGDLGDLWQAWDDGWNAHLAGYLQNSNPHTKENQS